MGVHVGIKWGNNNSQVKIYEVTGTKHAYYLLRKMSNYDRFVSAYVTEPMSDGGTNTITYWSVSDIRNDLHGKFSCLLDRNNSNYDNSRKRTQNG
jgi:hypothetical protein